MKTTSLQAKEAQPIESDAFWLSWRRREANREEWTTRQIYSMFSRSLLSDSRLEQSDRQKCG